jgi:hypothetical protein
LYVSLPLSLVPKLTKGSIHDTDPKSPSAGYITNKPTRAQLRKTRRTLPCKFYNSAAGCLNGPNCSFLHTLVVPDSVNLVDKPRPWRTRPCRHYQVGRCLLGDACHFAHVYDGSVGRDEEEEESDDDLEIVSLVSFGDKERREG